MHNAPSVSFPVGHCAFYGWMQFGLGLMGWAIFVGLLVQAQLGMAAPLTAFEVASGLVLCLGWTGVAAWQWRHPPQGQLHWVAMAAPLARETPAGLWRWQPAGRVRSVDLAQVVKVLDLQSRCLLRIRRQEGGAHWLWVEQTRGPDRWDDLRRALVALP